MEKRTITIVVDEKDLEMAMIHLSSNRPGKPLVAIQHLVAVDGDEGYDLNEFEEEVTSYEATMSRKTGVPVEQMRKEAKEVKK